jgi:hypothetical protein
MGCADKQDLFIFIGQTPKGRGIVFGVHKFNIAF